MSDSQKLKYEQFESRHSSQLIAADIPKQYWCCLHKKLLNEVFDAGEYFQILDEVSEEGEHIYSVVTLQKLHANNPNNIFLIDHAWTFRPQLARKQLREIPGLLDRMCATFNIEIKTHSIGSHSDHDGSDDEDIAVPSGSEIHTSNVNSGMKKSASAEQSHEDDIVPESISGTPMYNSITSESEDERRINEVLKRMWCYIQTYTIRFAEKEPDECDMPLWYIPDEFGVRIGHSETPNCRMVPIFYTPDNIAYSVLVPIEDIEAEQVVTRDYVDTKIAKIHPEWRHILMYPWAKADLSVENIKHVIASDEYFSRGRIPDILPKNAPTAVPNFGANHSKIRVFTDDSRLLESVKQIKVDYVDRIEDADVIWMRKHFNDYESLYKKNPNALVNQFPHDCVLTVKDLLAASIQSVNRESVINTEKFKWPPMWFETTFNLETELPQFVAYYQQRALRKMNNIWIIKPWNLARGLDMHVTDDLSYIIRLIESGPKIACKYIHRPVLFCRPDNGNLVKFDLRYIIFLKSVDPLEIFVFKKFWVRFAINDFALSELDNRETHFTVFNYSDEKKVLNMKCEDFIEKLEQLYPVKWTEIQNRINEVIKEAMQVISREGAPRALTANGQSRAMYGMDLMLKWDSKDEGNRKMLVSLIEGNFMPDCDRACKFYDDFADDVIRTLFVNHEYDPEKVIKL